MIHGVHANIISCRREWVFDDNMPTLQDHIDTTCITPLQDEPRSAEITVRPNHNTYNALEVSLLVSSGTSCFTQGITVVAKPNGSEVLVECSTLQENEGVLKECIYMCYYFCGLDVIHVVYQYLNIKGVSNTMWELCEIKVQALKWTPIWHKIRTDW